MILKNIQIEKISVILRSLGEETHPMLAYRVALLSADINSTLEALEKARTPSHEFQVFTQKHTEICKQNARKDANGEPLKDRIPVPAQNAFVDNYNIGDVEKHQAEVAVLEGEYHSVLLKEAERRREVVELLNTSSELELKHKIKYSWCEGLLSGNDMALLLQGSILEMDKEPVEDTQEVPEA